MGLVIGTGGIHIGTSGGGASPVKRFDAEAEYIKRKAGGTDNIGTGKAKIPTLKGKSLVRNQLIQNGNFADGGTNWTVASVKSYSYTNNSAILVTNDTAWNAINQTVNDFANHTILVRFTAQSTSNIRVYPYTKNSDNNWDYNFNAQSVGTTEKAYKIIGKVTTQNSVKTFTLLIRGASETSPGEDVTVTFKNINIIDLTLMFGPGHEPSTVEEFEAMYPLPYYDYNPGEIINNEAEAIETVGFNQWDEEWESGSIDANTGEKVPSNVNFRSKNFIPVIPGATYYVFVGDSNVQSQLRIRCYDAEKNYLGADVTFTVWRGNINIDARCHYIMFYPFQQYGTVYNNDICLNLSDPAKNGTYEPYEKHTLQLGLNSFDVKDSGGNIITVNGLKSAGSVYDEIDLERGKYIKRVGAVDMGSKNWFYESNRGFFRFSSQDQNFAAGVSNTIQLACSGLTVNPCADDNWIQNSAPDKSITMAMGYSNVRVKNSAYTDAATFKTANSGVTLYYELATPIEYDLVTPIGNSYKVISGGTEERLPRDTASSVMAPIKYSVKYVQPKE